MNANFKYEVNRLPAQDIRRVVRVRTFLMHPRRKVQRNKPQSRYHRQPEIYQRNCIMYINISYMLDKQYELYQKYIP